MVTSQNDLDSILKRRGFLWSSFEIYGGTAGFIDYGPLGTALKNNILHTWRNYFVLQEGFAEIDTPNITPYEVFRSSGHLDKFNDIMIECSKCKKVYRADQMISEYHPEISEDINVETLTLDELAELIKEHSITCPVCQGTFERPHEFNLMFKTDVGRDRTGYLHPETAQGIFVNFQNLYGYFRGKMPIGVVQIGKGFRNEISPRLGVIRMREFNMAEAEVFINPEEKGFRNFGNVVDVNFTLYDNQGAVHYLTAGEAVEEGIIKQEALAYYMAITQQFLLEIGIEEERLRFRQHEEDEMAHYAQDCWDAEVHMIFNDRESWIECVGIANRSCYDLEQHMNATGTDLRAFERYDEPVERKVERLKPDLKKIGVEFRKDAGVVREFIESQEPPFPETLTIDLNGEAVIIPDDFYTMESRVEKISGNRYLPWVIEPSFGIDRILYGVLQHNFHVGKEREGIDTESYSVMRFKPEIAPIKVAVFPLFNKLGMPDRATGIYHSLIGWGIPSVIDDAGSIGKRYARQDEIGTPYSITVDHQTVEDGSVTIRDRDSTEQIRIDSAKVPDIIHRLVHRESSFKELDDNQK